MQQRVVEDEQLVIAQVVSSVADDNVSGSVLDVVDVVQDPEGCAHPSEVERSRDLLVEDRKPDGLDVFPRSVEGGDVHNCFGLDAIVAPQDNRAFVLFRPLLDLADEIGVVRGLDQALDFVLMARRHVLEAINALVEVGQREQIQQNIDGRQHPEKDTIAEEIASHGGQTQSGVPADVISTTGCIEQCDPGEEIRERSEHAEGNDYPSECKPPNSAKERYAPQRFAKRVAHVSSPRCKRESLRLGSFGRCPDQTPSGVDGSLSLNLLKPQFERDSGPLPASQAVQTASDITDC